MNIINILLSAKEQAGGSSNILISMLPLVIILVLMYLLFILPQQRAQKKHAKMISELKKGDKIVTNGGIHGTISKVKDTTFIISIADKTEIEIDKIVVGRKE